MTGTVSTAGWLLLAGVVGLLTAQILVLRPTGSPGPRRTLAGRGIPTPSGQHPAYITLEAVTVRALPIHDVVPASRALK